MTTQSFATVAVLLASAAGCNKHTTERTVLQSLYRQYTQGSIDECRLNGRLVYTAGLNAYDAAPLIYDSAGRHIGTCNYAWGKPDSICKMLQSCETVYRCSGHITGEPFVDKYGLSK